jgi:hypothetical protein
MAASCANFHELPLPPISQSTWWQLALCKQAKHKKWQHFVPIQINRPPSSPILPSTCPMVARPGRYFARLGGRGGGGGARRKGPRNRFLRFFKTFRAFTPAPGFWVGTIQDEAQPQNDREPRSFRVFFSFDSFETTASSLPGRHPLLRCYLFFIQICQIQNAQQKTIPETCNNSSCGLMDKAPPS